MITFKMNPELSTRSLYQGGPNKDKADDEYIRGGGEGTSLICDALKVNLQVQDKLAILYQK